jgi:hypothetical protein
MQAKLQMDFLQDKILFRRHRREYLYWLHQAAKHRQRRQRLLRHQILLVDVPLDNQL